MRRGSPSAPSFPLPPPASRRAPSGRGSPTQRPSFKKAALGRPELHATLQLLNSGCFDSSVPGRSSLTRSKFVPQQLTAALLRLPEPPAPSVQRHHVRGIPPLLPCQPECLRLSGIESLSSPLMTFARGRATLPLTAHSPSPTHSPDPSQLSSATPFGPTARPSGVRDARGGAGLSRRTRCRRCWRWTCSSASSSTPACSLASAAALPLGWLRPRCWGC